MAYWRVFYHVVWATQNREPLVVGDVETIVVRSLRETARELQVIVHAIGVMPDHVHVAISIPPKLAVANVIGRLKGASSRAVNTTGATGMSTFAWQAEYGVLSFGEKALPDVVAYVTNQQERHKKMHLWPTMEQYTDVFQPARAGFRGVSAGSSAPRAAGHRITMTTATFPARSRHRV